MRLLAALLLLAFSAVCSGFRPVAPGHGLSTVARRQSSRTRSFTPGPGDRERKITRKVDEEGEYFESEFDRQPIKDRLPVAGAFLAVVSLPFIVGLVYLYSNK